MATTPVPVQQSSSSAVQGYSPPENWRSLRGEMDRLFDRFFTGFGFPALPSWRAEPAFSATSPAVDITEDDAGFKVSAELPGMTEQDIEVSVSGAMLTIKGEKRQEREEKKQDYHLTERSYGAFRRSFALPEGVDADKISASFDKGILTVAMPKGSQSATKKIEVKSAA